MTTTAHTTSKQQVNSKTETLLASSPGYTKDCELYPKLIRDTINEYSNDATVSESHQDPEVNEEAERRHLRNMELEKQRVKDCPEEELALYPCASRHRQSFSKSRD